MIHTQSSKINHYLGLVDIFLQIGKPKYYEVEFRVGDDFITDAYTLIDNEPVLIELQRSVVSNKKMQDKVDKFVKYHKEHGSKKLWIFTDKPYELKCPNGFTIEQKKMTPMPV